MIRNGTCVTCNQLQCRNASYDGELLLKVTFLSAVFGNLLFLSSKSCESVTESHIYLYVTLQCSSVTWYVLTGTELNISLVAFLFKLISHYSGFTFNTFSPRSSFFILWKHFCVWQLPFRGVFTNKYAHCDSFNTSSTFATLLHPKRHMQAVNVDESDECLLRMCTVKTSPSHRHIAPTPTISGDCGIYCEIRTKRGSCYLSLICFPLHICFTNLITLIVQS